MKKLLSISIFTLTTFFAAAQDSEVNNASTDSDTTSTSTDNTQAGSDNANAGGYRYFLSTNSGLQHTPVGFRIGVLNRMGGYIGARFGKGNKYEEDSFNNLEVTEATLFAASAGLIFPIHVRNTTKVHTYCGIGYGQWFSRLSKSGQTMGVEFEGGFMVSYRKLMVSLGGALLTGDGNSPKGDMTVGVGFRF